MIEGRQQCWIEFSEPWQWQLYMTLVALAVFVLPALIITICYAFIVFTIWAKGKQYTQSENMLKCTVFLIIIINYNLISIKCYRSNR